MLSPPVVRVVEPRVTLPPAGPPLAREPMVSSLESARVAPAALARVTAAVSARAEPPESARVPAEIVVPPV